MTSEETPMTDVKVPFYGHVRQYHSLRQEIDRAIQDVLESGQYVLGSPGKRFEQDLAAYFGLPHAAGVNSGTDALWLAFLALGVAPGDEIITTANTFFATAEAIWIAGAKAVFVDCEPRTRNIDPWRIETAITRRTRGIVPVHLYGLPADMRAIAEVARKHRLWVVEDDAQAIDAKGPGWRPGELSDAVCTSFIIQKNLGTFGDGGAVITRRADVDAAVRRLRNHGSTVRSVHSMGYNSRLDDLHAAILGVKLRQIARWTDRRREIATRYTRGLLGSSFALPYEPEGYRHAYHLYVIETPERDRLERFLIERGVDVKLHYPIAIHRQEGYPWGRPADPRPVLPNCERNADTCLSLPMFPELTDEEVDYVIAQCLEWDRTHR
jgi:dTDP-4-amino-4,6-dideoxygalactose transaminase